MEIQRFAASGIQSLLPPFLLQREKPQTGLVALGFIGERAEDGIYYRTAVLTIGACPLAVVHPILFSQLQVKPIFFRHMVRVCDIALPKVSPGMDRHLLTTDENMDGALVGMEGVRLGEETVGDRIIKTGILCMVIVLYCPLSEIIDLKRYSRKCTHLWKIPFLKQ